jgi:hypothetical protein
LALAALLSLAVFACAPGTILPPATATDFALVTPNAAASATATPFKPLQPTAAPTFTFTPTPPSASATPTPTDTPTPNPSPPPSSERAQYAFEVVMDYAAHSLSVDEGIQYPNRTGQKLKDLVLAVEPNRWTDSFSLNLLELDGDSLDSYTLSGQRLQIELPELLSPDEAADLHIKYDLALPPKSYSGTFGYLGYQANLTDWYPFVVPYEEGQGWILHDPLSFGEHLVYESADYDIELKFKDAKNAPVVAASAPGEANGKWTHYHLQGARTFVFSVSPQYKVKTSAVGEVAINSYYFSGHQPEAEALVWAATQALGVYSARFAPYPYDSLSIVETELPDGQEYDGLVFLSSSFYDQYNGTSRSNLIDIGVHEMAHQWWFGLVGDDQALEPWLDEALATYSEHIFYEFNYPGSVNWWWNFRVYYLHPTGWVDTSIYDGGSFRPYTNAVYMRGAEFLDDLRVRIGDKAFFNFLKDYASEYAQQIVTGQEFFDLLNKHTDVDYSDILKSYFQGYQ